MTRETARCPACGRQVQLLLSGQVRQHKPLRGTGDVDTTPEGWCVGGRPGAEVVEIGTRRRSPQKRAPRKPKAAPEDGPADTIDTGTVCGARRGDRGICTRAKGYGTDHTGFGRCKQHGGASPNGRKYAALERARAELAKTKAAMRFYGQRVPIDPEQAMLEEMQRTVGAVRWMESMLTSWGEDARLAAELATLNPDATPEETQAARALLDKLTGLAGRALEGGVHTVETEFADPQTGMPSLVAIHSTEHAVGFTDTEYAAWLKVYQAERRHLVLTAKACIDADVEQRRQEVLEARALMIRRLLVEALRIAGVKATEDEALQLIGSATRLVVKELPAS